MNKKTVNKTNNYEIVEQEKFKNDFYQQNHISYDKIDKELFLPNTKKSQPDVFLNYKKYSYWTNVSKSLITSPLFIISLLILVAVFVSMFVFSFNKEAQPSIGNPGTSPAFSSKEHWFGLGFIGEDYWNEVWIGTRMTTLLTIAIVAFQLVIGLFIGSIWGYFKKSDLFFINVINILNLAPTLIFILLIITIMGAHFMPIVIAISIQSWIGFAIATRVQIMIIRNNDYNVMSNVLGTNPFRIMVKNIIPKIAPVIVSIGAFAIPDSISWDTSLSYLNFGFVDGIHTTSLGYLLQYTLNSNKWIQFPNLIIFPTLILVIISFSFFLLCHRISDSLNPKNHNKVYSAITRRRRK